MYQLRVVLNHSASSVAPWVKMEQSAIIANAIETRLWEREHQDIPSAADREHFLYATAHPFELKVGEDDKPL